MILKRQILITLIVVTVVCGVFVFAKKQYTHPDFGKAFGSKALAARQKMAALQERFTICSKVCKQDAAFMQAIVFPEVMRYNTLKDDIETESLRTLYVQFGHEYANFSIGLFQMKPAFAETVETKARQILPDSIFRELQLAYTSIDEEVIRMERIERLQDTDYQLVYLTAFVAICNTLYSNRHFTSETEKLQWYATTYNAGFDKPASYIITRLQQDNFYLQQDMPGKKFRYAAIATWYYTGCE
jgi:hypothetical protein